MRKVYFFLTIAALVPLLLFIGCATDRYAVQQKEVPPMTLSEKGITVTVNYLTKDQLYERYGERNNPFIPPASLGGFNQAIVFDILIESSITADFILKYAELQAEGKVEIPKNIFHLGRYWEMELRNGDTPDNSLGRIKKSIKKEPYPEQGQPERRVKLLGACGFFIEIPPLRKLLTIYPPC